MSDENVPTVTVEAENVKITVTDAMSAEGAMPFIEGALEYYLGERRTYEKQRCEPVEVDCDNCGYEWTYRGKRPRGTTCPDCNKYTQIDAETEDRA